MKLLCFFFQESGIHQDDEQPPEVPPFIERRHKKPKSTSTATTSRGETLVQVAEAFTSILNRPHQAGDKEEGNATAKEKSTNKFFFKLQSVILWQLKEITNLLKEGTFTCRFEEHQIIIVFTGTCLANVAKATKSNRGIGHVCSAQ